MSFLQWLKENFELLAASGAAVFGFGGIVHTQKDHSKRLDAIENREIVIDDKLTEIHGDIKTLLERTKHL
jgi:hypothetical protein